MNADLHPFADDAGTRDEHLLRQLLCEALAPAELSAGSHASLRRRLLQRVGESARKHAGLRTVRSGDGIWRTVRAGIAAKMLWQGPHGASVLIEFAPGASLPVHRHQHLEEGIILRGDLHLADLQLRPGDYHVSPPGSRHGRISSRAGGLAYLRGTSLGHRQAAIGELLGGLLPGDGPAVHTCFASEEGWLSVADGVDEKLLWQDGEMRSRFLRWRPGGCLPAHVHAGDEECMMLSGDVFFGDLLVRAGDFHLAPAGSEHGGVFSDSGAMAFVRSRGGLNMRSAR
ncbi:MAG TPA: cupin domain-containing protein [Accumulibacter sp.]|nr:cupin domain-containing protein [Accumulibacter sp.]